MLNRTGFGNKLCPGFVRTPLHKLMYTLMTNALSSYLWHVGRAKFCSLSPLLFTLAIELLCITMMTSPLVKGDIHAGIQHRLLLYVDDLLLFITNSASGVPSILSIMAQPTNPKHQNLTTLE